MIHLFGGANRQVIILVNYLSSAHWLGNCLIASNELSQQMGFWYIYGKSLLKCACNHTVDVLFVCVFGLRLS